MRIPQLFRVSCYALSGLHGFLQRSITKADADFRAGLAGNLTSGSGAARSDPYYPGQQDSVSELVRAVREVCLCSAILCLHLRPLPFIATGGPQSPHRPEPAH